MKYLDYKEDKQQGTFDFPVAFYHVEANHPRYQMPYHWHLEYEIIRVLEGYFHLIADGRQVTAQKGDLLLIPGGALHGGNAEECVYECIVFDMKLMLSNNKICNKLIQQLLRHEISISLKLPADLPDLKKAADDLFRFMHEKTPGYEFLAQGALFTMLGSIFHAGAYQVSKPQNSVSAHQIKRLKAVLNYIEEHYAEPISLDDMSRIAGLSPRYFCRFFRKMTQCTPTEYLNYYRIESACEQLADAWVTITDVAFSCGFNDISYFIKSFHKAKGLTPKQYKELSRQISVLQ